tara:strand:+ start:64 stop:684 length:621 start_codon:yes stop_codon:yes gene_type:complete
MATSVNILCEKFNLSSPKRVDWNEIPPTQEEGIYIVSLSSNPEKNNGTHEKAPISEDIIKKWLTKVGGFELDKINTFDSDKVIERLSQFWLPDENILYIGKAPKRSNGSGIATRVREYYNTEYGEKRPHSGGHWLKSLTILNELFVYYSVCEDSGTIEKDMMRFFCNNVSEATKSHLRDPYLPLPFANLQLKRGQIKKHGLGKMKI